MSRKIRIVVTVVPLAGLLIASLALANHGTYGWTLFVVLPMTAGALGAWGYRPRRVRDAVIAGAVIGAVGCALFLVFDVEGFICVVMALPVVVPPAIAGSLLAYWGGAAQTRPTHPAAMCLLIPVSMFFDTTAKPPMYPVSTSIVINAAPERVWKYVVAFSDIPAQPDWVLRTGLAYPIRTVVDGTGVGAARDCDLSTGTVKERVTVWDEPRLLRFEVMETPPAMEETGLYGPISPKHLNGYYISKAGQFTLTPLAGGRTLVVGTSWYQHGLWPAGYWRLWSDTVVHHIHKRVLLHIREMSESDERENYAKLAHER